MTEITEESKYNQAWLQGLICGLRNNGEWFIPRSGTLVRFNKSEQTAEVHHGKVKEELVVHNLKAIGFSVTEFP